MDEIDLKQTHLLVVIIFTLGFNGMVLGSTHFLSSSNGEIREKLTYVNKYEATEYGSAAFSHLQTSDGGFALFGYTYSYGAGDADMWLVKTDLNGVVEWNQTYGGPDFERGVSIIQTNDSGFILAGISSNS